MSDKYENIVKNAFQQAKDFSIEASPYLETRILAEIKEKRKSIGWLKLWKVLATTRTFGGLLRFVVLATLAEIIHDRIQSPEGFRGSLLQALPASNCVPWPPVALSSDTR